MAKPYNPKTALPQEVLDQRKKSQFLRELLENGGFMERAIRDCKTSRRFITQQRELDEHFDAAISAIKDMTNERIEEEIYRRAVLGTDKPLSYQGKLTGHSVKEYSDNLLMFYAKANMPGKYRDLPQKGSDLTDEELNTHINKLLDKRGRKLKDTEPTAESAAVN